MPRPQCVPRIRKSETGHLRYSPGRLHSFRNRGRWAAQRYSVRLLSIISESQDSFKKKKEIFR